ncbi:MAG TPA: PilZ domain-containing protein [Candidatus Acidoferrum sp.]|nr:PilZ domain-containing protein [Candidatus Acidoferrum sp.]
MEQERRRTPRYPFAASAELIEASSGTKTTIKVSELSLNGCYVESPNPMEKGAALMIKIFKEPHFFEATARVAYSQANVGMGLMFLDTKPFFIQVLQRWLLEAMVAKKSLGPRS